MLEEILRLIGEFVEEYSTLLFVAFMKILGWVQWQHPVLYFALGIIAFVVAGFLILQTWHVLINWWSIARRNISGSRNIGLGGEPTMVTSGENTKSRAITREQWPRVFEAMAWTMVAAFAMLLLQARQVDRWDTAGKLGILVVVLLFGVAMTYLRSILFAQSKRFKSVEAESFVLKQDGIVFAKLGREENRPAASLELYNNSGFPAARLGWDRQSCEIAISLHDLSGKEQVRISPGPTFPPESGARTLLSEDGIALYDGDGTEKLSISLTDGNPKIALYDKEQEERITIELTDNATRLSLAGKNSILCFLDDKGDKDAIRVFDHKGKVIWSAP